MLCLMLKKRNKVIDPKIFKKKQYWFVCKMTTKGGGRL
jgi:hypothetical protein